MIARRMVHWVGREVGWVVDRLVHEQTLEVLGLEITTQKRATQRAHNAFILGQDSARADYYAPDPKPRRHLHTV